MNPFTEEYYKTANYSDYMEREQRYHKLAQEIYTLLRSLSIINKYDEILDFGCATGFLIRGFNELGHLNTSGIEVSDWALEQCKKINLNTSTLAYYNGSPKVTFMLDVLEHMTDEEINAVFDKIPEAGYRPLVVRIPVASTTGGDYHLEVSRRDPTHINCKTKEEWKNLLDPYSDRKIIPLNLYTIYDSPGVMSALIL